MYTRLKALRSQHKNLDSEIRQEEKRPAPDHLHIRTLKKFKLRLREEISRLERTLNRRPTHAAVAS
ncbi:conserved hypothetical protein [Roseibium sp. TrichSKD4]|uniref:YdcH family protein n=1 Tax=Roseibium sp. TrichSKD4 TaxID=744980 RepID=UPI0001E571FF|nr:YdcH family protein [Roseibium sp. TrichSKD4]EFO29674.1 conserved hypothetical protein [Roseibium sp. TrichSKD4]